MSLQIILRELARVRQVALVGAPRPRAARLSRGCRRRELEISAAQAALRNQGCLHLQWLEY